MYFALVPLVGDDLIPSDLLLSEAIFSQVVELSWQSENYAIHEDVLVSVNQILAPGDYAVVFGSGLFGATGYGWMPYIYSYKDENVFDDVYFTSQPHISDFWRELNGGTVEYHPRFIVNGEPAPVPEPSTLLLLASGLIGLGFYSRRKKKND